MPDFQQDVYVAIRTGTPPPVGSGTWDDPYNGATAAVFDALMADSSRIKANQTIHLLPGTYETTGNNSSGSGWKPQSGQRILGSGIGATTLRLVNIPQNATRYAIAVNFGANPGEDLDGFSLEDLTIDCNLSATTAETTTTAGAVRIKGKHIYLRRVKVVGHGTRDANGTIRVITAAGNFSEDCVIDSCIVEPPDTAHVGAAFLIGFEGSLPQPHRFCTVRNCAARGIAVGDTPVISGMRVRAITPGIGIGTVIEGNQIANCAVGVESIDSPALDLVVWNNSLWNVWTGLRIKNDTSSALGRITAVDNIIDLATKTDPPPQPPGNLPNATGIRLETTAAQMRFTQVLIRKNTVRDVQAPLGINLDLTGVSLEQCGEVIVENNVLGNIQADKAVVFEACPAAKFFNNQTPGGELLRARDGSTQKYRMELADEVQDVLLPI